MLDGFDGAVEPIAQVCGAVPEAVNPDPGVKHGVHRTIADHWHFSEPSTVRHQVHGGFTATTTGVCNDATTTPAAGRTPDQSATKISVYYLPMPGRAGSLVRMLNEAQVPYEFKGPTDEAICAAFGAETGNFAPPIVVDGDFSLSQTIDHRPESLHRYEVWRRTRLVESIPRRIV